MRKKDNRLEIRISTIDKKILRNIANDSNTSIAKILMSSIQKLYPEYFNRPEVEVKGK